MKKTYTYSTNLTRSLENQFKNSKLLGEGNNGLVFSLSKKKLIKIFYDKKICDKEYKILLESSRSKYFPKVYEKGDNYIVRELIEGQCLYDFLKDNPLTKEISKEILNLLMEFKRLNFTKLDIRCRDLYIDSKGSIKIIDPKNNLTRTIDYPRHLMKGLNYLGHLNEFLEFVKEHHWDLYCYWSYKFHVYITTGEK